MPKPKKDEDKYRYSRSRDTLDRVHYARQAVSGYFNDKWNAALENARFFRLQQYSDSQLQKFLKDKRVPYVLDYMTNAINTYIGVQRDTRTDILYRPFKKDDEVRIELLNIVKDNALNSNNFTYLESDIFQDGLVEKTGCYGMEWSTLDNPVGELKIYRIPPRQLTWDLNRREYEVEEGQWVSRTRLYTKKELSVIYPEHEKEIMALSLDSGYFDDLGLDETYFKQIVDYELGAVALIEFFEMEYKDRQFLFDRGRQEFIETVYNGKQEAEKAIREIRNRFEQQEEKIQQIVAQKAQEAQSQGQQAPQAPPKLDPPELEVITRKYRVIKKSEIVHDMVVKDSEITDLQHFPYTTYHPYWHDGEWWGAVDTFKDPQRFVNKMFAMIDHQIGTGSKGLLLIDEDVPEEQANKIINNWSKTGGAFRVRGAKNNYQFIPPTGFDPRLIDSMQVALNAMLQKAGGANFMGGKEGAAEAAAAIRQRIEQGGLSHFMIYDNLSRTKRSLAEKILWYLTTYQKASQRIRVEGQEVTQLAQQAFPQWFEPSRSSEYGFLTINTDRANTISGLRADIVIDEARHSTTRNQAVLAQLGEVMQSSPMMAETIPPQLILELTDIPASDKLKWKQWVDLLMQKRLQQQHKPPTLTAKLENVSLLPPEVQPQFLAMFGLQAQGAVQDQSTQLDQLKLLQKESHFNQSLEQKKKQHNDHVMLRELDQLLSQEK